MKSNNVTTCMSTGILPWEIPQLGNMGKHLMYDPVLSLLLADTVGGLLTSAIVCSYSLLAGLWGSACLKGVIFRNSN